MTEPDSPLLLEGVSSADLADDTIASVPPTEMIHDLPLVVLDDFPPRPPSPDTATTSARARLRTERRHAPKVVLAGVVLLAMTTLVFVLLRPDLIFSTSTPTGGDNAAHIWTSGYLKRVLIPHGRLWGWSNDSFAGLPVLSMYFPLPSWLIVALSYVIPFAISFKLVTIVGILTLPWACLRLGRRADLAWPEPLFLAAGTFPFLLSRHYKILGGNILSTMAGEFSFSISLTLAVLYMGSLVRLLRTGRGRTRTTAAVAAMALCHIVPTLFAAAFTIACLACECRKPTWRRQIRDVATVGVVAAMLTAFWTIPFARNLPYTNSMDYERNTRTLRTLFPLLPHSSTLHTPADGVTQASIFVVLMAIAVWVGIRQRNRFILTMTLTALISGLAFAYWPRSAMWNNRLLPLWFFCVYTLGGIGFWHAAVGLQRLVRRRSQTRKAAPDGSVGPVLLATALILSVLGPAFVSTKAHLPFAWATGNYTGTEGRKVYPEYRSLISVLGTLECGRLFAEPDGKQYDKYGSTLAITAMPYWTKGCIQTIDGLYYEASSTTPFHYLTASMMSTKASHAQRRLPYTAYDMTKGVDRLRSLGVRYVLLVSDAAKKDTRSQPGLRFLVNSGPFDIFEVRDFAVVRALTEEPVVVTGVLPRAIGRFTEVGLAQWVRPQDFPATVAIDGPPYWQRSPLVHGPVPTTTTTQPATVATPTVVGTVVAPTTAPKATAPAAVSAPNVTSTTGLKATTTTTIAIRRGDGLSMTSTPPGTVPPATVSSVVIGNQLVSFDVDRPGVPVLVRVSWFPNWKAHGAAGPYRVAPNFMVVIPTRSHVSLTYEYTRLELGAIAISLGGLVLLITSGARSLRARRREREASAAG
jgi:hypothetical protein